MTEDDIVKSVTAKLTGEGFYVGQRIIVRGAYEANAVVVSLTTPEKVPHGFAGLAHDWKERITVMREGDVEHTYPLPSVCRPHKDQTG